MVGNFLPQLSKIKPQKAVAQALRAPQLFGLYFG